MTIVAMGGSGKGIQAGDRTQSELCDRVSLVFYSSKWLGRYDEAAVLIKRAQELDPLSSVISINISWVYQLQNNHDACVENTSS